MNCEMVESCGQKLKEIAAKMRASFEAVDNPESIFLINGCKVKKKISIVKIFIDLGINKIPKYIMRYFFNWEIKGNSVYVL